MISFGISKIQKHNYQKEKYGNTSELKKEKKFKSNISVLNLIGLKFVI